MPSEASGPRIVLAGSVSSSLRTLQALLRHGMAVVGVLGLSEAKSARVSGYEDLRTVAEAAGVPYLPFQNINAPEVVEWVRALAPDVLFITGLSQLVKAELMGIPGRGVVGYHPTHLPKGRGRAPVAWTTLDGGGAAATFFVIDEGVDAGPILIQRPFDIGPGDDAGVVVEKLLQATDEALDEWLPRLKAGEWNPVPQDDSQATYNAKREPVDGLIDWQKDAAEIVALVRASSRPHPGAYCYHRGTPLVIWRAEDASDVPFRGVVGRVLDIEPTGAFLVQAGRGLVRVLEHELSTVPEGRAPRVGEMLQYVAQAEIHALRARVAELETRLTALENR
ncbi:MAG: methionyl-tRNA formyltransferase [Fimbriimonas sp.]